MATELERINPRPMVRSAQDLTVGNQRLTQDERKVFQEYKTEMAVITAQAAKTVYAEQVYGRMVQEIHNTAVQTLAYIDRTQEETKSPAIRVFCEREKQLYMYQALEMLTTGGELIHQEVGRSIYPPPKPSWRDW